MLNSFLATISIPVPATSIHVVNSSCAINQTTGESVATWSIDMTLNLVDMPGYEDNATYIYDTYTHDLNVSVISGDFTKTMKSVWRNGGELPGQEADGQEADGQQADALFRAIVGDEDDFDAEVKAMVSVLVDLIYPPSFVPTEMPTEVPTAVPTTAVPTEVPTINPSETPSGIPTETPSSQVPTAVPTNAPSDTPTTVPTVTPTTVPSGNPTDAPSMLPTMQPSEQPSLNPTVVPSALATTVPTEVPSMRPSTEPTALPTQMPTYSPSVAPSVVPTELPTCNPTVTATPTEIPSELPTALPTPVPEEPTLSPTTAVPSEMPSDVPTETPTITPSETPSAVPTESPTQGPTETPTEYPTYMPTISPTEQPTQVPSTALPSHIPTHIPTATPTAVPTKKGETFPPSFAPTPKPEPPKAKFSVDLTIGGYMACNTMSALDNNAVQQAFIGVTNIEASSITAVICGIGASRRLQGTGGGGGATRELLFTYELAIPMEVKTKDMNDASVEALASAIRDSTVAQLKLSSESGSFIESLQQNYIQQREFTLSSDIAASSVEVQFAPTAAPTMDPGSSPASSQSGISLSLSTIIMAAVAAAIGILVAVIIYCRYYYLFQSTTSKRAKISPRNVSYSMDDEEEEEIQSTMYESPRHNLDHSSRYDNGSPLVVRIDSGRDSSSEEEEDEHAADLISSVSTPKASPVLRRPLHSPDESTQMKTPPGGAALFKQEWLSATKIIDGNIEETGMMSGGSGSLRQSKSSRHSGASRRVRQETRQQSDDVSRSDSSNGSRKAPSHALANPNPTEAVVIPGTGNVTEQDMYDVSMVDKSVVRIIHSGSVELRLHACTVARKASSISSQRKDLTRPELGLLPALLHVLREDGMDSCKINALGTIRNLVTDEACAIQWIQHDTGLLEILSFGLGKALRECMRKEQTRQGVIPNGRYDGSSASMQHFFETFNASSGKDSEETEVLLAAGVLKNLSVITSNAVQIAAPALGLLEVLIEFVKWGDASTKTLMLSILANLVKRTQSPFARLVRADNEEFALLLVSKNPLFILEFG